MPQSPNENVLGPSAEHVAPLAVVPTEVRSVNFSTGTGTIPELSPVYWDSVSGGWKPWVKTKAIEAFLYQGIPGNVGLTLSATDKVLANVLWGGTIRRQDLPAAATLDATATEADLDADLVANSGVRLRNFTIQNLVNFR